MRDKYQEAIDELIRTETNKLRANTLMAAEQKPISMGNAMEEYYPYIKENIERLDKLYEAYDYIKHEDFYLKYEDDVTL